MLSRHARSALETQLVDALRQRAEGEVRWLVNLQEDVDHILHERNGSVRRRAVSPPHASSVVPPGRPILALEDDFLAVPYRRYIAGLLVADVGQGKLKFLDCPGKDVIDPDEDGRAEFDRHTGVVVSVHGERAPANPVRFFENSDIDSDLLLGGKLLQMVSCRRSSCSSS